MKRNYVDSQEENSDINVEPNYSRIKAFIKDYLYLLLCAFSYFFLDFSFRYFYRSTSIFSVFIITSNTFSICFVLIFLSIILALPRIGKRIFMIVSYLAFFIMTIVHGVMNNIFGHFASFSDLGFAGDGADFLSADYIAPNWWAVACGFVGLIVIIFASIFASKKRFSIKNFALIRTIFIVVMLVFGIVGIVIISGTFSASNQGLAWDGGNFDPNSDDEIYSSFNDRNNNMFISGFYHYTYRDFIKSFGLFGSESTNDMNDYVTKYISDKTTEENEYTALLEGKNLIMIQMESIDSWMLTEQYMPNLYALQQNSVNFTNYFASVFISAGTFNSEFIANTGIIPDTGSSSQDPYYTNDYRYSLPNLFRYKGYTANSYHGSEGTVYNRGTIHPNLGFEKYVSGSDMNMYYFQMDSELITAYDKFTSNDPYYSFIITFSGHGPYNAESQITKSHIEAAEKAVDENLTLDLDAETRQNYVWCIAHAMETDQFIGDLMAKLEQDGKLDDTAIVLYADHFNYYMMNEPMIMEIKGFDNRDMIQQVPFMIYSTSLEPQTIDKPVASLDILPTLANLFGLDVDRSVYVGNDMFSSDGGYVIFANGNWYDGQTYYSPYYKGEMTESISQTSAKVQRELQVCKNMLICDYFATH